jgi:hypothetical protein
MIITLWVQADALVHRELHRYLAARMVAVLGLAVEALSPLIREEGSQAYRVLVLRCITVKRISGRAKLALLPKKKKKKKKSLPVPCCTLR